jgi:hypothetical protein
MFSTSQITDLVNQDGGRGPPERARTYNADGQQLNNHLANTTDLDAGAEWAFSAHVTSADDGEDYDIQVSDSPF